MNMKFGALAGRRNRVGAVVGVRPERARSDQSDRATAPVSTSTDMGIVAESGNTWPAPGGIYTGAPRAAVIAPHRSYAAVPSSGYHAAPAYGAYGPYSGATVGYGDVDID